MLLLLPVASSFLTNFFDLVEGTVIPSLILAERFINDTPRGNALATKYYRGNNV